MTLVAGWVPCLGRRPVPAVVLAAGAADGRHSATDQRFVRRARWSVAARGRVLFGLAVAWLAEGAPLVVIVDATRCRTGGQAISGATLHHHPLRSTRRRPVCSCGHGWVVLALWAPAPLGKERGFARPIRLRRSRSRHRGGRAAGPARRRRGVRVPVAQTAHDAPARPPTRERARELGGSVAGWADERPVRVVADRLSAGRTMLDDRPATGHVISRLRMDAARWTAPATRRPGERGRTRRRGVRLPPPTALAAAGRHGQIVPVLLDGRAVTTQVFVCRARWYVALRSQPVRIVIVRDPSGRRADAAVFGTDRPLDAAAIREASAHRWTLEVTCHDAKPLLGFAAPQQQRPQAVRQTAPLAGLVSSMVLRWYVGRRPAGATGRWVERPW